MKTIYLSGSISGDTDTYDWRTEFTNKIDPSKFKIIDPCKNGFNQKHKDKELSETEFLKVVKETQGLLKKMDYNYISKCDIMVVNLNYYGKVLIGTLFELDWAKEIFKIPIISIQDDMVESNPYIHHPFVTDCISYKSPTVDYCVSLIHSMF